VIGVLLWIRRRIKNARIAREEKLAVAANAEAKVEARNTPDE